MPSISRYAGEETRQVFVDSDKLYIDSGDMNCNHFISVLWQKKKKKTASTTQAVLLYKMIPII